MANLIDFSIPNISVTNVIEVDTRINCAERNIKLKKKTPLKIFPAEWSEDGTFGLAPSKPAGNDGDSDGSAVTWVAAAKSEALDIMAAQDKRGYTSRDSKAGAMDSLDEAGDVMPGRKPPSFWRRSHFVNKCTVGGRDRDILEH